MHAIDAWGKRGKLGRLSTTATALEGGESCSAALAGALRVRPGPAIPSGARDPAETAWHRHGPRGAPATSTLFAMHQTLGPSPDLERRLAITTVSELWMLSCIKVQKNLSVIVLGSGRLAGVHSESLSLMRSLSQIQTASSSSEQIGFVAIIVEDNVGCLASCWPSSLSPSRV